MPAEMIELYSHLASVEGALDKVVMIGVLDTPSFPTIAAFNRVLVEDEIATDADEAAEMALPFVILREQTNAAIKALKVDGFPSEMLVDPQGRIVARDANVKVQFVQAAISLKPLAERAVDLGDEPVDVTLTRFADERVFRVVGTGSEVTVETASDDPDADSVLVVVDADGKVILENDDIGDDTLLSRVTFTAAKNTTYYVRVMGYEGQPGAFTVRRK